MFVPKTKLGRWSVKLAVVFWGLFGVINVVSAVGNRVGGFDAPGINVYRILIPLVVIPAGLCGAAALFTGAASLVKSKVSYMKLFKREGWSYG